MTPFLATTPTTDAPAATVADGTRVVLVTDADVLAGTEQHMLALGVGLTRRGLRVTIACPPGSPLAERAAAAGLTVYPIARKRFATPAAALDLRRLLANGSADVLHAHNGRALFAAALAVTLAGRGRCVATQHFLSPSSARRHGVRRWASDAVHRFLAARTHRFIAISHAAHDALRARGAPGVEKTVVVLNGMDVPPAAAAAVVAVRQELGLIDGQPLLLCAARLEPEKGLTTLLAAMHGVREKFPDAVCVIAGEGSMRADLVRRIEVAGLGRGVRLLGFRSDVPVLMAAADVFLLPAPAEPFGLVLLEAMAAARPVIAVNVGGPTEIVVDGDSGLLVPPDDGPALAGAVCRLLADPGLRRSMADAGHARWRELFTVQRMAEATAAVYASDPSLATGPGR